MDKNKTFEYSEIRKIRDLVLDEMKNEVGILTVDHLILAEMRVQTIILAGADEEKVKKEKPQWQKK